MKSRQVTLLVAWLWIGVVLVPVLLYGQLQQRGISMETAQTYAFRVGLVMTLIAAVVTYGRAPDAPPKQAKLTWLGRVIRRRLRGPTINEPPKD